MKNLGRGDSGYTDLFGPERVPKYDARVEAYGTIDEATSALGMARAASRTESVQSLLMEVQQDLYMIMAELATPANLREKLGVHLEAADVERIDTATRAIEERVPLPRKFILPGACMASAALDFARAVVRRAERQVAKLIHDGLVDNEQILRYLNRTSSLLFVMARDEEYSQGIPFSLAERRQR